MATVGRDLARRFRLPQAMLPSVARGQPGKLDDIAGGGATVGRVGSTLEFPQSAPRASHANKVCRLPVSRLTVASDQRGGGP